MPDHDDPNLSDEIPPTQPTRLDPQRGVRLDRPNQLPTRPAPETPWMRVPDPATLTPATDATAQPGIAGRPDARLLLAKGGRLSPNSFFVPETGSMVRSDMAQELDPDLFIAHRPKALVNARGKRPLNRLGRKMSRQSVVVAEVLRAFGAMTYAELEQATGFPYGSLRNTTGVLYAEGLINKFEQAFGPQKVFEAAMRSRLMAGLQPLPRVLAERRAADVEAADAILSTLEMPLGSTVMTGWDIDNGITPTPQSSTADLVWESPSGVLRRPDAMVYRVTGESVEIETLHIHVDAPLREHRQFGEEMLQRMPDINLTVTSPDPSVLDYPEWWPGAHGDSRVRTIHHIHPRSPRPTT